MASHQRATPRTARKQSPVRARPRTWLRASTGCPESVTPADRELEVLVLLACGERPHDEHDVPRVMIQRPVESLTTVTGGRSRLSVASLAFAREAQRFQSFRPRHRRVAAHPAAASTRGSSPSRGIDAWQLTQPRRLRAASTVDKGASRRPSIPLPPLPRLSRRSGQGRRVAGLGAPSPPGATEGSVRAIRPP
jgi:hypothetical protein